MMNIKYTKLTIAAVALAFSAEAMSLEWNVSLWGKRRAFTEHVEKLAELVAEKSGGDFTLNISYGGLSKSKENLDGISIGAFEMAQTCSFYHPGKNPTITAVELPFLKDLSLSRVREILDSVHAHPLVVKDLGRWNATILMPTPLPQYNIVAKGDTPQTLADFDGLRVRGPGGMLSVLANYGAVKTNVPFSEVRQSMDSGVIDGPGGAQHLHLATKSYSVGKWFTTNLNLGSADCPVIVNTDSLADLSDANRDALMGSIEGAMAYYIDNYENNTIGKFDVAVKEAGLDAVTFDAAQVAELNGVAADVRAAWVAKHAGDFDSQALFDHTAALFAE
jgi:TRAP-type C4-dicarboxylate transport system substrate-binding protein